jgi:hypothetical protein
MNIFEINWAAFAVVYIAGFVLSSLWFGPKTFYPIWWKLVTGRPEPKRGDGGSPLPMFGLTMLGLFAQVFAIAVSVNLYAKAFDAVTVGEGALVGLFVGGLVGAGSSLGHRMFSQHGFRAWLIEVTPDVIAAVIAGAVLAAWR